MSNQKLTSTDLDSELNSITEQNNAAYEVLKTNMQKMVGLLKTIVNATPEVVAIRWVQYTPVFNDGDPCEFSVNKLEIKFNQEHLAVDEETKYNDWGEEEDFVCESELERFFERQEDVINFKEVVEVEKKVKLLQNIHQQLRENQDELERSFGNNVRITVTRAGIEKEDYDCGY